MSSFVFFRPIEIKDHDPCRSVNKVSILYSGVRYVALWVPFFFCLKRSHSSVSPFVGKKKNVYLDQIVRHRRHSLPLSLTMLQHFVTLRFDWIQAHNCCWCDNHSFLTLVCPSVCCNDATLYLLVAMCRQHRPQISMSCWLGHQPIRNFFKYDSC